MAEYVQLTLDLNPTPYQVTGPDTEITVYAGTPEAVIDVPMPSITVGVPGSPGATGMPGPAGPPGPPGSGSSSGVLLLATGAPVPEGTPPDTIIYRKAPTPVVWDFTGGSLPSGWSAHGTPTGVTFDGTGMSATYDGGDGHHVAMPSTGTECVVTAELVTGGSSNQMLGVILADDNGHGVASVYYSNPAALLAARSTGWTYGSAFQELSVTRTYPAWMRLRHSPTAGFPGYASRALDGVSYSPETGPTAGPPGAGAPSLVSVGSILGTVATKVKSVTFAGGIGGLQGYWNGSAVVPF